MFAVNLYVVHLGGYFVVLKSQTQKPQFVSITKHYKINSMERLEHKFLTTKITIVYVT